tara:strand:+ start:60 stop:218 length:159 start_codon:yes stop_codon:yes gene_type:complete
MIKRKIESIRIYFENGASGSRTSEIKLPKDARRARREMAFLDLILIRLKIIY